MCGRNSAAKFTPEPTPDFRLPEFQAAAKLRQEGKLSEARAALTAFIQKYPAGQHVEEAKDLLGEVNVDILLSRYPSPEKQEYIVRSGDVLQKIAHKLKSTPELIMRMNNLSGTMLHIGDRLLVSHPQFSIVIQRKPKLIVLLDDGAFFKQYHIREEKLPPKQPPKVTTKVVGSDGLERWQAGRIRQQRLHGQHALDPIERSGYTIYSVPDSTHPTLEHPARRRRVLALSRHATSRELSSLVNKQTPVTD